MEKYGVDSNNDDFEKKAKGVAKKASINIGDARERVAKSVDKSRKKTSKPGRQP